MVIEKTMAFKVKTDSLFFHRVRQGTTRLVGFTLQKAQCILPEQDAVLHDTLSMALEPFEHFAASRTVTKSPWRHSLFARRKEVEPAHSCNV